MRRRQFGRRQFIGASLGALAAAIAGKWRLASADESPSSLSASTVV